MELKDNGLRILATVLVVLGVACFAYILYWQFKGQKILTGNNNTDCVKEVKAVLIKDDFTAGVYENGEHAQILWGFYTCNEPQKGQYAAFQFALHIPPSIRKIVGVPGDTYSLIKDESKKGRWWLVINGEKVPSKDGDYFIESNTVPPLKTYSDFKNVLQADEYILISEVAPGFSDSGNFGLVHRKDLIGKAK